MVIHGSCDPLDKVGEYDGSLRETSEHELPKFIPTYDKNVQRHESPHPSFIGPELPYTAL
jgi:hypothetical protein